MEDRRPPIFRVFNEIGIISQLSNAALARRLPDGLHPSQFALLSNLTRLGDGKTPADLARAFQVPKASMTNTLMQLEKRGFITVNTHPDDMRKKQVFVTEAGRAVFLEVVSKSAGPLMELTSDIEGLEEILPVLEALRKKLDENRNL
ncbi:MarR family transcriptional regulator [uncultured Sulfitobacter sp.]|uniref:MarR family winged helix-turn-helix transcriptional regulator n=1 Tax=uncultured Sulfitobacter sp. TaxID=191468 RepID=UPI00263138BD|nr:MarR family transcriptional regulator [uncultured Sulfitobacter sp.]